MKRLTLEYRLERELIRDIYVEDEIYENFMLTHDYDALPIDWNEVRAECENQWEETYCDVYGYL